MADGASIRHALLLQETGAHNNDWGTGLNDALQDLEDLARGVRTTATTGGTTALTTTTSREPIQRLTGILVSNCIIEVPAVSTSWWIFKNETTGLFSTTVKVTGQTGVVVAQGETVMLRCNGTDVVSVGVVAQGDVQSEIYSEAASVGGNADAITLVMAPVTTAYVNKEIFRWVSGGPNTITNPTVNRDAIGAKTIKDQFGAALVVGATGPSGYVCFGRYNGTDVLLLNPAVNALECLMFAIGDESTAITTGTKLTFRMPYAFKVSEVRASLSTASSSGLPAFDIKESGTTILSTTITIDANEKTSKTAATPPVISDGALADDAEMTLIVDTAGTGAKGAKIYLIGRRV